MLVLQHFQSYYSPLHIPDGGYKLNDSTISSKCLTDTSVCSKDSVEVTDDIVKNTINVRVGINHPWVADVVILLKKTDSTWWFGIVV